MRDPAVFSWRERRGREERKGNMCVREEKDRGRDRDKDTERGREGRRKGEQFSFKLSFVTIFTNPSIFN